MSAVSSFEARIGRSRSRRTLVSAVLLLLIAASWCILPRVLKVEPKVVLGGERYDAALSSINSLDAADQALPSYVTNTGQPQKDIVDGIQRMLELRFVHGFSRFSPQQNWIAAIEGALVRAAGGADDGTSRLPVVDLPVSPDEILKHPDAMCTQQMLVFQALLKRRHIDYARVSFMGVPSHDAVAAKVDGVWRFYDPDMEPTSPGVPLSAVLQGDVLPAMYPMLQQRTNMGQHFRQLARDKKILVRDVNRFPAARGAFLQRLLQLLSQWGWILVLLCAAWLFIRANNRIRIS